ncbi:MAG: hypothetical protein NWF10_04815 [Candidatus Bathyarchaeota archaeon]|nr:hypothetical protein [Candidatus Bathyarchaeota archaeon]
MKECRAIAICIVALIFAVGYVPVCFAVDVVEATSAINQAELSLNSAFVAVAEADDAGADVVRLLDKLDVAGDFLSGAHLAFRAGDHESASLLAVECSNSVEGLATDAGWLKADAERTKTNNLLLTAVGSGVGLVLLLVLGIVGWRVFKKRYSERVLEMRPEVEEVQ